MVRRSQGAHLGHAPGMPCVDAVSVKFFHHRQRAGRTTNDHPGQALNAFPRLAQVREQIEPNGGHPRRHRHAFFVDERCECGSVTHFIAGHHHLGACCGAGIGIAPGVDVEHRHDRQHHVTAGNIHRVGYQSGIGVQHGGTVAVEHALGVTRRARRIAKRTGRLLIQFRPLEDIALPGH